MDERWLIAALCTLAYFAFLWLVITLLQRHRRVLDKREPKITLGIGGGSDNHGVGS